MNTLDAYKILRLEPDADEPAIIAAYTRLVRRYPMTQFPEKYARLLAAKTHLLDGDAIFQKILYGNSTNLTWLPSPVKTQGPELVSVEGPAIGVAMQDIFRPVFFNMLENDQTNDVEKNLAGLMDEFDEEQLFELFSRYMGGHSK